MYTTIEAQLHNGTLSGPEVDRLPQQARVLITLLGPVSHGRRPAIGTRTSHVEVAEDAFAPLSDADLARWGL